MMLYWIYLGMFAAFVVAVMIKGVWRTKTLTNNAATGKIRIRRRIGNIIFGICTLLVVFVMCLIADISFADVGLRPVSFDHGFWFTAITLGLNGLLFLLFAYQLIASIVSDEAKKDNAKAYSDPNKSKHDRATDALRPRNKKERVWGTLGALNAGIMEEIVARGFLFYILQALFPNLSIVAIIVVTSIVFGIAHFYQGITGIVKTALAGGLLGCLFVVTGSLILPMFLHFFVNFSSVFAITESDNS